MTGRELVLVTGRLAQRIIKGEPVMRGDGSGSFPYVHVDNLVDAMITAMPTAVAVGQAYNIVDGQITGREYLGRVCRWLGVDALVPRREVVPWRGRYSGARAGLRAAGVVRRDDGGDRAVSGRDRHDHDMTAVEWTITVTDAPAAAARGTIMQGLNRYNQEKAGYWDSRTLAVLVSDPESHEVIGGVLGHTSLGLAFIDLVFLPERRADRTWAAAWCARRKTRRAGEAVARCGFTRSASRRPASTSAWVIAASARSTAIRRAPVGSSS